MKDINNADLITNFRFWLIEKLAGKTTVLLNARIAIVDSGEWPNTPSPCKSLFVKHVRFIETQNQQICIGRAELTK